MMMKNPKLSAETQKSLSDFGVLRALLSDWVLALSAEFQSMSIMTSDNDNG